MRGNLGGKTRYGFLGLRSYDPSRQRLVQANAYRVELPEPATAEQALELLELTVSLHESEGCWANEPEIYSWQCGCSGDALSGPLPCGLHMDDPDAPMSVVGAKGVWFSGPRQAMPAIVRAGRSYPVPL